MTVDERAEYRLTDRYALEDGRVFLSGVQAVARLAADQLRADRRTGLTTAAFVSGYQGSPLASFGEEAARVAAASPDLPIVVRPGVNEELAATSVMGSQLAVTLDDCRYDGVVGVWFGKGPGLDRASDAIRHAVFAGTSHRGGVVAVVGDDPAAKSSTLPSSSDATMVDLHMPILFPGDVQEALDLGRHAVALSRACGLWVGLKVVTAVADGTGTVDVHPDRVRPQIPHLVRPDGTPFEPRPSGRLLTPYTLDMEREFVELRSELAREYGRLNGLNRIAVRGPSDWIGIAASGHTYHEVREALQLLGLDGDDALRDAGVRLFHLLQPVPFDVHPLHEFADGITEILVVEEKNPTLERLVRDALYDLAERPRVLGRRDLDGEPLVPATGTLDADALLAPLRRVLARRLDDRLRPLPPAPRPSLIPLAVNRTPFYCSGCPHNVSTRAEPGTLVGGGIGCHAMVALMDPDRVGDVVGLTAMGGEGAQWIGMEPFVDRDHLVQNLGDGTFFHSGSLAVRAAVAAGSHITYKLLYNGTVAMTGGQDPAGQLDVPAVVRLLLTEGVTRVIVTTDDLDRYEPGALPEGVDVWDRTRLAEAQEALAAEPGVTVLLHDQACAAEKRRARSRGTLPAPTFRVVINERVCEGCGDCGDVSNCLSVQPVDTPFGRKTRIHQTSCNLDLTCLRGDCPSFATVTVEPAERRTTSVPAVDDLPAPVPLVDPDRFTVRMSGIGGTGVVTVSQVLGTAAMLDGRSVRGLDQTGLSQKAGPVVSDLRITRGEPTASNHAAAAGVDCLLAFDLLVAASDQHRRGAAADRTVVVASIDEEPTGQMVTHPDTPFPAVTGLRARLEEVSRADVDRWVDAAGVCSALFGSSQPANVLLLGVAVQAGAIPVDPAHVEQAIALNGVAVERNVAAFRWGRRWAVDPADVERRAGMPVAPPTETLDQLVDRLAADLVGHTSRAYARRFRDRVEQARAAERSVDPASTRFAEAVARHLHRLMAYKDEYEVARLLLLPESRAAYEAVGGRGTRVTHRLHPPVLRALGVEHKIGLRRSAGPALRALRAAKRLRGTALDPFRFGEVRRTEREMIPEYEAAVDVLCERLADVGIERAAQVAALPDQVRGYEHLKLRRARAYRAELADTLAHL
ncbi:MAG: indolepyruvate ferredoxin oxidoreductase family protein [Ilumatobacteraceae bacterium]|nr:indolepyruvate ferredoxin oxidoreductase family protein [Ilumatobacteraceae bacterium]